MVDFTLIGRSAETDDLRFLTAPLLLNPADNVYHLIRIPWHAFVTNVIVALTAGWAADSTITVGFDGNGETADPDAFLISADIVPDGSILTRSLKDSSAVNGGGKWFDSNSGAITVTTVIGAGTALSAMRLFVEYKVIHSAV